MTATNKVWKELLRVLEDVHGNREGPVDKIAELAEHVEAIEDEYLKLELVE